MLVLTTAGIAPSSLEAPWLEEWNFYVYVRWKSHKERVGVVNIIQAYVLTDSELQNIFY